MIIRHECVIITLRGGAGMEKRIGNIIIQTPGGTAGKSSSTYKVSLPSSWIREMGITEDNRQIELSFDGTAITISRRCSLQDFIRASKEKGNELLLLSYYDGNTLCTEIAADYTEHRLCVEDHVNDFLCTAFGNNQTPTWEDFQVFLEERCIPRARAGLREYLDTIGVDSYDPLQIIRKTAGRMAEDQRWLKVEEVA